jgi:hypothetical protein
MIVPLFFVMSLFMAVDPSSFNHVFDYITIGYTVFVVLFLIVAKKRLSEKKEEGEDNKKAYVWKKKSKILTWQQKYTGTWEKLERTNFYEVNSSAIFLLLITVVV